TTNLIGNGVVLDPVVLKKECDKVAAFGVDVKKNLFISHRTHLILPTHRALDKASELSKGTDKFGFQEDIGPWEEEFFDAVEFLKQLNIVNGEYFVNNQLDEGKKVLAEGA